MSNRLKPYTTRDREVQKKSKKERYVYSFVGLQNPYTCLATEVQRFIYSIALKSSRTFFGHVSRMHKSSSEKRDDLGNRRQRRRLLREKKKKRWRACERGQQRGLPLHFSACKRCTSPPSFLFYFSWPNTLFFFFFNSSSSSSPSSFNCFVRSVDIVFKVFILPSPRWSIVWFPFLKVLLVNRT